MIRTDWLNTSVDDLRSTFHGRCNCHVAKQLTDIRDTAVEAVERGHRSRAEFLHGLARRAERGCPGDIRTRHSFKPSPTGAKAVRS